MREDNPYSINRRSSLGRRIVIAIFLLLFLVVLGGTAWMMLRKHEPAAPTAESNAAAPTDLVPAQTVPTPDSLAARMLDLEQRLVRTTAAAQAASGYANRAEAIMVAFAARRSLDAGQPLGYLEGELRVLFGDAQPKAVATIINAAGDPVTLNKLRAGLEDIDMLVTKGNPKESWWAATTRTLGSLVVVRHAGEPNPAPEQRLSRARRAVEAGQIEGAIAELAALPPQPAIAQWLDQARRYNEAHRALDVIEAAAMLEPRTAPAVTQPAAPEVAPQDRPRDGTSGG